MLSIMVHSQYLDRKSGSLLKPVIGWLVTTSSLLDDLTMSDLHTLISEASQLLLTEKNRGAGQSPIPSSLDHYISQLIETYITTSPSQQHTISEAFSDEHSFVFLGYAQRMAALAVRDKSPSVIYKGLAALALENARFDVRENMIVMATLLHSARKIGINPKKLFEDAARLATDEELIEALRNFPDRSDRDNILEVMGYEETTAPDGFRYKRGNREMGDGS